MHKLLEGYLLVTDLDGTLLDERGEIHPVNREAVERFVEAGGRFTVATGRTVESARPFVESLPVNAPVIVMNGSLIYDYGTEEIVWDNPLPPTAKQYAAEILQGLPDAGVEFSCGRQLYVVRHNETIDEHVRYETLPYKDSTLEDTPKSWHKVLYGVEESRMPELQAFCRAQNPQDVCYVATGPRYLEMLPKGSNKGETLKILSQMLQVELDKTFAIGDYYNDREFIEAAGCGAFAGNAPKELHALADLVVCHHSQGAVAEFIGHIERGTTLA